ncbi:unnamed protein product [Rotaria sp. Silwood2]|nr:unnamed protein product [Rotaria sp. Silwood2]CAF2824093.1 unnamed protein product [Rotaria sp. Silwood2]CAF3100686.1 unnamed protein product [Rotaria sp. Silwood2]
MLNRPSIKEFFLPIHRFCLKGFYPGTSTKHQQRDDEQVPWTVDLSNTNDTIAGKEIFKYMMEKSKNNSYYRLPSTWTTGTNTDAIKKTLKRFLLNIYQT